jgi:hypothetical protein
MIPAEGCFASRNPRAVVLAGSGILRAADPDGLAVAVFGWANLDTGFASNSPVNDTDPLGFVLPTYGGWQRLRVSGRRVYLRPGIEATLCSRGDFYARFPSGASAGQPVYASTVDGTPISGYAADAQLTPWNVITDAGPGQLAIISTWSKIQ